GSGGCRVPTLVGWGAYMRTLALSPISGLAPVATASSILAPATTMLGLSQTSPRSGVTVISRIWGSVASCHQALSKPSQSSAILARSFDTAASPEITAYLWPPLSAQASETVGKRSISVSL